MRPVRPVFQGPRKRPELLARQTIPVRSLRKGEAPWVAVKHSAALLRRDFGPRRRSSQLEVLRGELCVPREEVLEALSFGGQESWCSHDPVDHAVQARVRLGECLIH